MPEPRTIPRRMSAGVILVDREGRVLLQLRDDDPAIMFPGHWGITGGAAHDGETPEQTARREVLEETGIELGRIEPFRAYYFQETRAASGARRTATKNGADYELYLYHAPCETPAEEMVCGEGRELRFIARADLDALDIAYNHRDVLADFFASPAYAEYACGAAFERASEDTAPDPAARFIDDLREGEPWFEALMRAIARWERPAETANERSYRYLIGGEAFDWLLLAERLLEEARGRGLLDAPELQGDVEQLLFRARVSDAQDVDEDAAHGAAARSVRLSDERLRELIGESKHRAHLNYIYGVTVEEALQYAVELEVSKERVTVNIKDPRLDEAAVDPVYERVYGRRRADLLREFRTGAGRRHTRHIALSELREFMYWLFKYRVKNQEPARVASDTRKALAQLSAMEAAAARSDRARASAEATDRDPTDVLERVL